MDLEMGCREIKWVNQETFFVWEVSHLHSSAVPGGTQHSSPMAILSTSHLVVSQYKPSLALFLALPSKIIERTQLHSVNCMYAPISVQKKRSTFINYQVGKHEKNRISFIMQGWCLRRLPSVSVTFSDAFLPWQLVLRRLSNFPKLLCYPEFSFDKKYFYR